QIDDITRAREAQRAREQRAIAERNLQDARTALAAATDVLEQRSQAETAAQGHHDQLRTNVQRVRQQLHELEAESVTAQEAVHGAARARADAQKAHATAQRAFDQAERELARASAET